MNVNSKNIFSLYLTSKKNLEKKKFIIKYFEELRDEIICFLDDNKNIKIFSSICPHFGGEIYYDFKNNFLRCKWHDWKFCKKTGKCLSFPLKLKLKTYEFRINPGKLKNYAMKLRNDEIYLMYEKN